MVPITSSKKGYFFSIDALIALLIILAVLMVVKPISKQTQLEMHLQEDTIKVLSSIKIGELDNSYAQQLILNGLIKNPNNSVIEQISEFHAKEMPEAKLLADSIFSQLSPKENIGIWMDDQLISSSNSTPYENSERIWVSRQIISGLEKGKDTTGYSSRALLTKSAKTKYFYFGGYTGDGNISIRIDYTGSIKSAEMELAINNNFSVYINNNFSSNFSKSPSTLAPQKYILPISYFMSNITSGNLIELKGNNLYISGGYIKIIYESSEAPQEKKFFPGIKGLINIYDSFFMPSALSEMNIMLHFNSTYETFITIGNVSVYNGTSNGQDITVNLNTSYLSSKLNFSELTGKNIPIRIGLKNISYNFTTGIGNADSVLVTDVSGSMDDCVEYVGYNCTYRCRKGGTTCSRKSCILSSPGLCTNSVCGTCESDCNPQNYQTNEICNNTKLDMAITADKEFISVVLNVSGNSVGLVSYSSTTRNVQNLTTNITLLNQIVNSYNANGGTCICCGINNATKILKNSTKIKTILLMSDGAANYQCSEQGTGSSTQDAINAACQAYTNYNITVHAIGFNSSSSTEFDEATLQAIANCGHGNYSRANASNLLDIYRQFAQTIVQTSYSEQTLISLGNLETQLYPDSSMTLAYPSPTIPYGIIFTSESPVFGSYQEGNFSLPSDSQIIEARAISYSGSKWTKFVELFNQSSSSWQEIFNLTKYGTDYTLLGDPYSVNIPAEKITRGNNRVKITIGSGTGDSSINSSYDKIIYTLSRPSTGYSPILASASGCNWTIEFEDSSNLTLTVPSNYTGTSTCYYTQNLVTYNPNDAIDFALHSLLAILDLNSDNKIDAKFSQQDIDLTSNEISGIPYAWSSEIQVRVWREL